METLLWSDEEQQFQSWGGVPFHKRLWARHNEETQEFPEVDLFLYRILQLLGTLSLKMKVDLWTYLASCWVTDNFDICSNAGQIPIGGVWRSKRTFLSLTSRPHTHLNTFTTEHFIRLMSYRRPSWSKQQAHQSPSLLRNRGAWTRYVGQNWGFAVEPAWSEIPDCLLSSHVTSRNLLYLS